MSENKFEKLIQSVIDNNHPVFSRARKDMPRYLRKQKRSWNFKSYFSFEHFAFLGVAYFAAILLSTKPFDFFSFRTLTTTLLYWMLLEAGFLSLRDGLKPIKLKGKDIFMFLGLLGISLVSYFYAVHSSLNVTWSHGQLLHYLVPFSAAPIILRLLHSKELAFLYLGFTALMASIVSGDGAYFIAYMGISGASAIWLTRKIRFRSDFYVGSLLSGIISSISLGLILLSAASSWTYYDLLIVLGVGFGSSWLSSIIVLAFLPLLEGFSETGSDLKLLELAGMNHPLLKDLMVRAPGTYHHSVIIGSLVEAAAEAIQANPLLARVMAYYHDVGKAERPHYFIENQGGGYNRHDQLQPQMSAMVIREHVTRGQEMGRFYRLPNAIIAAMSEHHGSTLIAYFYNKAKSRAEDPEQILDADYRYDGQKPQSKETALVMLGDVVEAATRSLPEPSVQKISGVVKSIINKYYAEGQLSDCNLNLRDLDLIAASFVDTLLGIYHARIEYKMSSDDKDVKSLNSENSRGNAESAKGFNTDQMPSLREVAEPANAGAAKEQTESSSKEDAWTLKKNTNSRRSGTR